ncbi:MARCKS-related protein [Phaenicophaeus curvirostris]|uniref:MARCKS-related protein n=1 Tax=Phaenicophaeus curvirostris TaxID=33595 RepID=UPI0037F0FA1B
MGSQGSKAGGGGPPKADGQENGHVRLNGDMTPKVGGEAAPLNGNGSAEPLQEESKKGDQGGGDAIEPAPPAEGADAKPEGAAAPKDTPKKKKKFSFKKSFKLSGISFKKNKKEAGDSSGSSPTEERGEAEAKGEENPTSAAGGTEPSAPPEEGTAEGPQGAEPKTEGAEAGGSEEGEKQQAGESQGDAAKAAEPPSPAGAEPTPAAAEQKEE